MCKYTHCLKILLAFFDVLIFQLGNKYILHLFGLGIHQLNTLFQYFLVKTILNHSYTIYYND